jgi:penicillin-binding protein 1C
MALKSFLKTIYPIVRFFSKKSIFLLLGSCFLVFGIFFYFYIFKDLPSPRTLSTQSLALTTYIRDRNGKELYKIYRTQNRTLIPLSQIPLQMRQAILSIEDKNFYQHRGFSITGTIRALYNSLTSNRIQGGSTITQQLVKTSLLSPERTLRRKLRELTLSLVVEILYSKDQILEMYLNRVSFGGTAYGIEEASQTYFGKSVTQLNLAQISLLAGLPASPTTYSPYGIHPEYAKSRQKEVLRRMVADGYVSWEEAESASNEELKFKPPAASIQAPHFVMYIKDLLAQKYGTDVVEQGGLDVITSLDLDIQNLSQQIVSEETAKISYLRVSNGAALVTRPSTGEILAMVGSRDYFDLENDGNVNVTLSLRQPGSAIKPINYALAFSRGFSPASLIEDSPISYRVPGQPIYSPTNYDNRYHGKVTLRTALASSYNIPAVKLLSANGVSGMISLGQKMGITTWNDTSRFGLSLTLGGGEVTMLDLSTAYGVFANQGQRVPLHPILSVRDSQGRLLEEFRCPKNASVIPPVSAASVAISAATEITSCGSESAIDPRISFLISDILSDNSARTPTFGSRSLLNLPKVAVKTGTTNNLRDNWTIGYTPDILAVVWVGNNDNSPMSYIASGVTGASPIWNRIFTKLLSLYPSAGFPPPSKVTKTRVCSLTNQLPCSACSDREDYFLEENVPKTACSDEQIKRVLEENSAIQRDKLLRGVYTVR